MKGTNMLREILVDGARIALVIGAVLLLVGLAMINMNGA
jgi:hypothetical protein